MSFKELLKGNRNEPRGRTTPERTTQPPRAPLPERASGTRATSVLYLAADLRETRSITSGFTYDHPHLALDVSTDLQEARPRLTETGRYEVLVIGWSVPESEATSLITFIRALGCPVAIVALSEHATDALREAGADQCVQKNASLLTRLPGAIEDAVKSRTGGAASAPASKPAAAAAPSVAAKSLRVAFGGDIEPLKAALGAEGVSLHITSLAQALRDADVRPAASAVPFDVIVIDYSASGRQTAATLVDVRARSLDVPVVLVVDPREERAALQAFESGGIDECIVKTADWQPRLAFKLETVCARYHQQRELTALRVKESRLRALVDKLPACVVRLSAEGTVLATNAVAMSLLGATQTNQLLRKSLLSLVADASRDTWSDFVARVAAGEQRSCEVPVTTLDGISRTIEAIGVPSPAEGGATSSVLTVLRDVSDRKRLETALEEATTRRAPEHVLPAPVLHAADASAGTAAVPDGRVLRDLETDLHQIADRARTTFQELGTLLQDVTARHDETFTRQVDAYTRIKAEQREHWRSYESFVEEAAAGVIRVSLDEQLLTANRAFATCLGYASPDDVLAAAPSIGRLMDETRWRGALDHWRSGGSDAIETSWRRKDGSLATLRLRGRLVANPNGEGERVEVVTEDVSARRALETQLRRARRWEDAARVTSGIAADLRHLLTSIKDAADRLRDSSAHDDAARDHVTGLTQSVARAMALSRQLVAFGRKEARDPRAFDLNGALLGLEPVLRRLIDEHIELTLALTTPLGAVDASQPAIEEAVVHLAVAAAGALPAGGQIEMTTSRRDIDALEADTIDGLEPGVYGVLSMTASGWGLDEGVADRDDVRKALAAARRTTAQMGVSVSLASVPGTSLTFALFVPGDSSSDADHNEEFAPEVSVMPTDVESAPGTDTVEM